MLCSIEGSFYEIEPYISSAMQSNEYQKNDEAIREYQNALRTDVTVLNIR